MSVRSVLAPLAAAAVISALSASAAEDKAPAGLTRSARSGLWSVPETWEGGALPTAGARVQIRAGHSVVYDVKSDRPIRLIHIAGSLSFAPDRNTRLEVGLIKIQAGDNADEDGFDCDAHLPVPDPSRPRPALEVGTPNRPIDADRTAVIRLRYFDGMDPKSCPGIVCCGGRMDFHGAPMNRTWVKLANPAKAGDTAIILAEPVAGWRVGDQIILTATTRQQKTKNTFRESVRNAPQTEERTIAAVDATAITFDAPLKFAHVADGPYRADVANLSRNVVVESADPDKVRGHTMYHRHSAGSIGYAEFRHLGKPGVLGRYSLHFHLVGDTMRGSSVIGASIHDSGNRWLTIHGTNYLVVRDCVGYRSAGHGFFLEDGTEAYNVLDRNLAVQAFIARPLPKQIFPFDKNDGSGFWWANSLNTFTRNTAAECDEYGFFFQATTAGGFDLNLPVQKPDGERAKTDIRTLPFVRFEDNEAHCMRRHAVNLGGGAPLGEGVGGVGPDARHPFVVRNLRVWNAHWAIHPFAPSMIIENLDIHDVEYGIWHPMYKLHAYKNVVLEKVSVHAEAQPTGTRPREADFPKPLDPLDDLPPTTVVTHVGRPSAAGKVTVRGTTADNGTVTKVLVNGVTATSLRANFAEWEVVLDAPAAGPLTISARAEDAAGNVEPRPHVLTVDVK